MALHVQSAAADLSAASVSSAPPLGVFGGSGLYDLEGMVDRKESTLETPFGAPSGPLVTGTIAGARVAFLARHGRHHRFSPSEINYRANVHAMKQLGVQRLLSISAVGSLREGIVPGDLVLVDQFIDKTHARANTFFGQGIVGHVSFAEPVCAGFSTFLAQVAEDTGYRPAVAADRDRAVSPQSPRSPELHRGGTYVCMEGPQFSTRAESRLHRGWGADVIGMTAAPEAKLAREAELCFSSLALSTDYDAWRDGEEAVSAESVVAVLLANVARAQQVVSAAAPRAANASWTCDCGRAAERAVLTASEAVSSETRQRLQLLYGRYL